MARQFVGLDLGTAHTRIWTPEGGVILRSPSAAAIDSESHRIVALGADARRMLGKTPAGILAFRPIKDGVVSDFEVTSLMLEAFFTEKQIRSTFRRPSVVMATPYRITEVEQLAAENAVLEAGCARSRADSRHLRRRRRGGATGSVAARLYDRQHRCRHDRGCRHQCWRNNQRKIRQDGRGAL